MKYLKTYGRQTTKLSAWVSIEDRKQVFDSASSFEADASANQAPKPSRTSKRSNAAKKRKAPAPLLTSDDEDDVFTLPLPPAKTRARPKPGAAAAAARSGRGRKRKPLSLSVSSDENTVPLKQKQKAPKHRAARRKKSSNADQHSDENKCPPDPHQSSGSMAGSIVREKDSLTKERTRNVLEYRTVQKDSLVHLPSAGRFVTRRRCAISSNSPFVILNSSDEFGPLRAAGQNNCPSKRTGPPVVLESSADSSVNAAVLGSFATIPHREISLNESVEHILGPCSRKPIFCSTPSTAPLNKRSKLERFKPISSPASISVSRIVPALHTGSPQHASPRRASAATLGQLRKRSGGHHEGASDSVLAADAKGPHGKTSPGESARSQCEEGQSGLPSMITIDDDVSSYFTSASGEIDWLADFLRAKCLTQLCTVRLERIEDLVQLFSATAYSSCLGDLESVCSSSGKEPSLSAATSSNSDHVKDSELDSGDVLKSPVPDHTFVGDGQCGKPSVLDDRTPSEHTSTTDLFGASTNGCTDVVDLIELSSIIKSKCLSRECSVELVKLPRLSPEQQLMSEAELCENEPHTEAAALATELKEKCLDGKPFVKIKKMSITDIKDELQANTGSDRSVCDLVSEETGSTASDKVTSVGTRRKRTSARSNDGTVSEKEVPKKSSGNGDKGKRRSAESKEKKGRTSTHRPGTTRKACVSGLSVSRWKSRDAFTSTFGQRGGTRTIDCSINELIPSQHNVPAKLTDVNMAFSTPVKGHNLNFSSLLAELTPHTQTWSRLKAALSVHRKVMLTPKTPGPGRPSRMAEADLSQDLFGTPFRTPLPKRLRSQRMTHESPLAFDVDELSDAEKVYTECGQQRPLAWGECLQPPRMKQCVKIGEGTFGEVFSTTSGKPGGEIVALKVIPLEGSEKVNGEEQKTFGEILHEIIISKELSCLKEKEKNQTSGFIGLRDLHCVKGGYPTEFLNAWDKFDKQKGSENDRPDFFENEQLFIILEFEFGGTDLENSSGTLPSITVAKSILHQVTAALAVAEQELHFEHRDLHWGNVLVKVTKQKTTEFSLNGAVLSLETKGVLVRIIDYSLSRLEIDELTVSCDISNDEELFMGQGDYQFDIYRIMRQENSNEWSSYNPHSNVLWLHYLCSKLLDMKYCGSRGKRNKDMRSELTGFYDNVLQFSSATEVLQHSPLFQ